MYIDFGVLAAIITFAFAITGGVCTIINAWINKKKYDHENEAQERDKNAKHQELINKINSVDHLIEGVQKDLTRQIEDSNRNTNAQVESVKRDVEFQVNGLKEQMGNMKSQFDELRKDFNKNEQEKTKLVERVVVAEEKAKSAHERVNDLVQTLNMKGVISNEGKTNQRL